MISSQTFRTAYEKFYSYMRDYLWPYTVLQVLADVEVDIYTTFIDMDQLQRDFNKLSPLVLPTCKEDEELEKAYNELKDLIYETDEDQYALIYQIQEVQSDENKQDEEDREEQHGDEKHKGKRKPNWGSPHRR